MQVSPYPRASVVALLAALMLVLGLVTLTIPQAASAATTTVPVTADTYVRYSTKNANYGNAVRWSVDGRRNAWRHAFLKFRVPAAPAGTQYVDARLRAFSDGSASEGAGPDVYTTSNDWTEGTLTWNNQPARGTWLSRQGGYAADTWVSWDVTSAIPSTGGTVSFRMDTSERHWLGFESSENDNGRHPQLVLTTEPITSTDPAVPDAGTSPSPSPSTSTSTSPTPSPSPSTSPTGPNGGSSAAEAFGWGQPVAGDEFSYTGSPDGTKWNLYDSAGHAGNGVRSPAAWSVDGNVVRVTGDSQGTTGGMSANFDRRKYGRWEVRMRTNARDPEYHPVLILWPDSGNWPCDGEIDYAEGTSDVTKMHVYHHYSCSNQQTSATRTVDTTQWHNYAVEWTPEAIVGYLDGVEWFRDSDPTHQPPGPMHQTIQLDWFPDGTATSTSWMEVDWVRVYDVGATSPSPSPTSPASSPTATTAPSTGDIKLAVLGDINHDGNSSTSSREGKIASSIAAWGPTAVTVAGDFQYQYGDCGSLVNEFDRTGWGALLPKTIAAAGPSHDYTSTASSAADYSNHMEGTCPGQTTGPSLSAQRWDRTIQPYEPHYVDLGAWTVVSMPSAQWRSGYNTAYGSQWSGSSLTSWLDSAVAGAKSRGDHVVVVEHEPYWSSGTDGHSETEGDAQRPWIDVLDKHDVPLVVSGHQHNYERFHPQNADGTRNDATGTQQFQVSTGGIGLRAFTTTAANSAVKNDTTFGWLRLVLHGDGSYDWQFVPTEGTFTDSGSRPAP